jgi:O-antigen biosynthesis protein
MAPPLASPGRRAEAAGRARPRVEGKFLWVGDEKLYVRGATYGTFATNGDGTDYPDPDVVDADFERMAASGLNAVRTYTVPPAWLLDLAADRGLFVMVGLPWEHHVAFLEDKLRADSIEERVRRGVAGCAGHPAVLCYTIGNEIRAPIARWHGRRPVERFLERLTGAAHSEDPGGLVTYVNYPTTEYLELPFLDLACFNVYLESQPALDAYLARLHNLVGDRPLILAEVGLDSRRNGLEEQAQSLSWQLRTTFEAGCAGAFVFAWTDEWHINPLGEEGAGFAVEDWDFGLTDRERRPKPALPAVRDAFSEAPFPDDSDQPRISVVVCTHNGASTLAECLDGLAALRYPDYEVIVVSDGSTDKTAAIVRDHCVRLIERDRVGLAAARNAGLEAATGEIVAYIDDDAWPDPDWLGYLAAAFRTGDWAGVGGPNLPPPDDEIAESVARAPGGPIHVLVSDREAEHIPGCNMAFRKSELVEAGGFDPRFRAAGDDVDICWRLQDRGSRLGFSPAAMVWHRRRNSIRAYWRQQRGYGEAEALLESKWPERYNPIGHLSWSGQLYGETVSPLRAPKRVRHGRWGANPFQSLYEPPQGRISAMRSMPERYLVIASLACISALGVVWQPLLVGLPLLLLTAGMFVVEAAMAGFRAASPRGGRSRLAWLRLWLTTSLLFLSQPAARLRGRIRGGLTPWRRRGPFRLALPLPRSVTQWREQWSPPDALLERLEVSLSASETVVRRGGEFDRWDLEVLAGAFGSSRLLMAIEEYPHGRQLVRWRSWPHLYPGVAVLAAVSFGLAAAAAISGAALVAGILGLLGAILLVRAAADTTTATDEVAGAIDGLPAAEPPAAEETPIEERAA